MKVLDLFCGLKGWSQPFVDRGHEVLTLDIEPIFNPDITADIRSISIPDVRIFTFDVLLASPPCEGFSVMQIGKNWTGPKESPPHQPKTERARLSLELVQKTIDFIDYYKPKFFVMENPRAKLRKLPVMDRFERRTVTYCQYGEKRMKPTDLWGGFPPSLQLKDACKQGDICHVAAPRGSQTGTQGMNRAEAAKIPYELALQICIAMESDL